ncbi:DEAD/DEAH box helicase family protein [Aquimarina sp. MMG016]|uniref:DEAD/DEAH box helicase family protein n=1 Tax=Aquimarina sp. MMG016 TaxID=2822690 RepID=UPI001B3A7674|nr:DEAD/DEAH box helicase family protein [Aquimarina sp. MMG016]MBQ4818894.1 DEAD/DEAH box helicase family protein [Aquimarina sp. MMG016]
MDFFDEKNKEFEKRTLPIEPIELYYSFDKQNDYSILRPAQEEVLKKWHHQRGSNNVLIKMNTGAGKTLTGLLMLYSKMLEFKKPVVYLCPDRQLVAQVIEQSKMSGIPTCEVDVNRDFPEEFLNAEAILIATVDRMFNGKNIFDRDRIVPIAILLDDAHRIVQRVIDSFTIKISENHSLYSDLFKLFKDDLKRQSVGSYEMLKEGGNGCYMKVPYWAWFDKKESVNALLVQYTQEKETLLFKWDLFHNNYEQYELFFTHNKLEISPELCYVKNISAYNNATYKYALSATFVNDHAILKDLDFSIESIMNPIIPTDRKDYGERLILAPKRYYPQISQESEISILNHHLDNGHNVVVLVPNRRAAELWEALEAVIVDKENIEDIIHKLKTSKGNCVVFINRYEGIDLSGDSCNVLVIHDHPKFKSLKNIYYEDVHHETSANYVAQTIEQGMGRSVRSGNDFSVVYLMGRYLLKFLRYRDNHKFFNDYTQKQIRMGLDLMKDKEFDDNNVEKIITSAADACLAQVDGWKTYYRNFMDTQVLDESTSKELKLEINKLEKESVFSFINKEYTNAERKVHEILKKDIDPVQKAWYNQVLGGYTYQMDKDRSNDYQIKSKSLSNRMLEPFMGKNQWKKQVTQPQVKKSLEFIKSFDTSNDVLLFISEIQNDLIYVEDLSTSESFEEALKNLGVLLGFESSRPEKESGEGSDVLWGSENYNLILEAKSNKKSQNKISKANLGQLSTSVSWFNGKYLTSADLYAVTLQPNGSKEDKLGVEKNMLVMDQKNLDKLHDSINKLYTFVSTTKNHLITEEQLQQEFIRYNLNDKAFIQQYLNVIK